MTAVEVTFTKLPGRRYVISVSRERGPALSPRQGPGYDDHLPHDAVHLIVESEAGLAGGVFGRVANGESNLFHPADPHEARRRRRREAKRKRPAHEGLDMARSELLASVCPRVWELRTGRRASLPEWFSASGDASIDSELVDRVVARLDKFAERWHALPPGGSVTLLWSSPSRRTTTRRGRV